MGKTCRFAAVQCFVKRIIIIRLCICSKYKQTGVSAKTIGSEEIYMYTVKNAICKKWEWVLFFMTAEGYTGEAQVGENSSSSDEAPNEDNCRGKGRD